ncbi:MAG: transposase [Candidatus Altiarchaeota archaeon]|nr:transposase [Candidatus Altiarchaeota archaeon]
MDEREELNKKFIDKIDSEMFDLRKFPLYEHLDEMIELEQERREEEELTHGLGYSRYDWRNKKSSNSCNGHTKKTVKSRLGDVELEIPLDTEGVFELVIVKKHERRLTGSIEDKIIGLYAKGMSNRDIYDSMKSLYGIEVSAEMSKTLRVLTQTEGFQPSADGVADH